jgi:hypothetical protein
LGAGHVLPGQSAGIWPAQLADPQNGVHRPAEQEAPVGHEPTPPPHEHLPCASQVLLGPTRAAHSAFVAQSGAQHPGRAAQMLATHGSQLALSADPWTHGSCRQGPGYSVLQQLGSASQIFCTHGLELA